MTALDARLAKAFRDLGASMMRCPHKPSTRIAQRRRHLLTRRVLFCANG